MENFFDIATPEEVAAHFSLDASSTDGADVLEFIKASLRSSPDYNRRMLASLYHGRGDEKRAQFWLDQIENPHYQVEAATDLYELQGF